MTKPKFTPDPPPFLQGMPVEKAFPLFVDWVIRQNYRIEDWWPKDFEDRVQALEQLSPYCIGGWTIADAAHVDFWHQEADGAICGQAVGTRADFGGTQEVRLDGFYNIDYSAQQNAVIVSGAPLTSAGVSLRIFRLDNGVKTSGFLNCTRSGHKIVSTPGTTDEDLLAIVVWPSCAGPRNIAFYNLTNHETTGLGARLGFYGLSLNNARIEAERDADILISGDWAVAGPILSMRVVDKSTYAGSTVNNPSGWSTNRCGVAATVSSTEYLICLNKISDTTEFRFYKYSSGSTITGTGVLLPDFGEAISEVFSRPVIAGTSIFWMVTLQNPSPYSTYFLETDFDGNTIDMISAFDTNNYVATSSGNGITYSPEDDSLYYMYGDVIWRYYIPQGTYFQCEPIKDSAFAYDQLREQSVIHYDGNAWTVVGSVDSATGWIIEKSPVSFS